MNHCGMQAYSFFYSIRDIVRKFNGEVFLCYLGGYGLGRVWIEGLRTDQLLLPVVHWPVSQLLAGVMVVVSILLIVLLRKKRGYTERRKQTQ